MKRVSKVVIPVQIDPMIDTRQKAYLDAMGIRVWSLRENPTPAISATDNAPRLRLGSGNGGILLVCAADTDSASRLANDISRALGAVPVWAWPDDDDSTTELDTAVDDKLFTTVAIFGHELAGRFFGQELPASVNSAKLVLLPSMQDIQSSADARRTLWATFCRAGMVTRN